MVGESYQHHQLLNLAGPAVTDPVWVFKAGERGALMSESPVGLQLASCVWQLLGFVIIFFFLFKVMAAFLSLSI